MTFMKKILFLLVLVFVSCDTLYVVNYEIENRTDDIIFIDIRLGAHYSYIKEKDREFTVAPGKSVKIFETGGVNAKDYVPPDDYFFPDEMVPRHFEKCDIYVGDIQMADSIRYRKNWDYSAKKLLGVYTLSITKETVLIFGKK